MLKIFLLLLQLLADFLPSSIVLPLGIFMLAAGESASVLLKQVCLVAAAYDE